jgi:hypothetical protein
VHGGDDASQALRWKGICGGLRDETLPDCLSLIPIQLYEYGKAHIRRQIKSRKKDFLCLSSDDNLVTRGLCTDALRPEMRLPPAGTSGDLARSAYLPPPSRVATVLKSGR